MTRIVSSHQWVFAAFISLFFPFVLTSCNGDSDESPDGIIEIDVLQAFETQRNLNASELIDEVEIIPLESKVDSYFRYSNCYSIGNKYILVVDSEGAELVLFDRKGKFIRAIGKKGKGPGEFGIPKEATMDSDEEFIYVYDTGINKLMKFSIKGLFINEISTKEIAPSRFAQGIEFINKNQFVLVSKRPYQAMDGYASLTVFDKDLNLVRSILQRANDENLQNNFIPHAMFKVNPDRMTFWEPLEDTLYTISPLGDVTPTHVIGFSKGGPDRNLIPGPFPFINSENKILSITEIGKYMNIWGMKNQEYFTAFYKHETKEIFEVTGGNSCILPEEGNPFGLNNDLYGVGYILLGTYAPKIDRYILLLDLNTISNYYDLDCSADKSVKYPKLRDQLLEFEQDPEGSSQKIMVLMKSKSEL
ncbi:MAG: 6-bladed beta-propeller [Bacteroidetes bacterium]|jgi:hypothetical protein|nr:6-bladed beta-propeller [Bacteroidota bacterium]MBT3747626.1 6-bladed beta-propeller [Bacteroidota bacterium]MBT4399104.1 6-bladed beta-propeller [Bacteroidota bacterium]MBT4408933.1 6-bladed beta-propeller [Bacteroidota bacterium]MBT5425086.1 6-bladed beta-propeller [Bacteroidota bacterium]